MGHCWFSKGRIRHSLRENEKYALLVDGHSLFAKGWDTMCLDKHDKADAINLQKPIIHGYAGYYVLDKQGRRMWLPSYMATILAIDIMSTIMRMTVIKRRQKI